MFAGTLFITDQNQLVYALPQQQANDRQQQAAPVWSFRERFINAKQTQPQGEKASAIMVSHY
jgi:hypothetical protein